MKVIALNISDNFLRALGQFLTLRIAGCITRSWRVINISLEIQQLNENAAASAMSKGGPRKLLSVEKAELKVSFKPSKKYFLHLRHVDSAHPVP